MRLGLQTQNAVHDDNPRRDFETIRRAGFSCADFSLHKYLLNTDIYKMKLNSFFSKTSAELEAFFTPHKDAAKRADVAIHQMHMPYPIYVPQGTKELNAYLWHEVAPKSMELCSFFECKYIVIHGLKLARFLGSEEAEWGETERFIESVAPMAKERGITICIENLYDGIGGHLIEGPCCNAKKAAARIDRINEKYGAEVLGFCLDTGHANLIGLDFESFITTLGARLKVLHIHDNDGVRDLHQIPFTFARTRENTSSTDWESFVCGLQKIKFQGVLNFETGPALNAFPKALHEDMMSFIAKIGRYFASRIEDGE